MANAEGSLEEIEKRLIANVSADEHTRSAYELFLQIAGQPCKHPVQELFRQIIGQPTGQVEKVQEAAVEILAATEPKSTHHVMACVYRIADGYHRPVLYQATQSFLFAILASVVGFALICVAIAFGMKGNVPATTVSAVGAALGQFVSVSFLWIYATASKERDKIHDCLERAAGFLLANGLCDQIADPSQKDSARKDLIDVIAQTTKEGALIKAEAKAGKRVSINGRHHTEAEALKPSPAHPDGNGRKGETAIALAETKTA